MTDITWHEVKGDEVWEEDRYLLLSRRGYFHIGEWSAFSKKFKMKGGNYFKLEIFTHYAKIGEVGR